MRAFVWLFRWLLLPLRLIFYPVRLWKRRRAAGPDGWIELELAGPIVEMEARPPRLRGMVERWLGGARGPRVRLGRLARMVEALVADPRARGLLVRIGSLKGGWAATAQIHGLLARVRASGKPVIVHLSHGAENREYFAATAGTQILALPGSLVAPIGVAASATFYKEALDNLGVAFEVHAAGRYKSAPEAFTRNDRSAEDLEQTTALVRALDRAQIAAVAQGRGRDEAAAQALLDAAPLAAPNAAEGGLIDGLSYEEGLPEQVQKAAGLEHPPQLVPAGHYLELRQAQRLFRPRRVIGVVEVHGAIGDSRSPMTPHFENLATEGTVIADLRAALAERRVAAVVLHVDSRGGSVIASDAIYAAVQRLNQDKPVIACFGDVAASGGYYVACGARAIVASPLTITGSIGTFLTLPTWAALAGRLGVHHDVVQLRKHASIFDPWKVATEAERTQLKAQVESMYGTFVELVARARGKTKEEIDRVAQGRVWIGEDAASHGLLDGLGGMAEAFERARTAAGVKVSEEPVLIRARRPMPRPAPGAKEAAGLLRWAGLLAEDELFLELLALLPAAKSSPLAYQPLKIS